MVGQLEVHLDEFGVSDGNVLVGEDCLVCAKEVVDTCFDLGVLGEDLIVLEFELLAQLFPPGPDGGLDVGVALSSPLLSAIPCPLCRSGPALPTKRLRKASAC